MRIAFGLCRKQGRVDRKEDLNGMGKSQKKEMECKLVFEGRRVAGESRRKK